MIASCKSHLPHGATGVTSDVRGNKTRMELGGENGQGLSILGGSQDLVRQGQD